MEDSQQSPTTGTPVPISLEKLDEDRSLRVTWSDDQQHTITFRQLHKGCQCAHCLEEREEAKTESQDGTKKLSNALPVLSAAQARPLELISMQPAGNYGYKVRFSDNKCSGIYTFELLYAIGQAVQSAG